MESKNSDEHELSAHDAHLDVTAEEVKIDVQAAVLFAEQKLDPVFQEFSSYQLYVIANADPEHLAGLEGFVVSTIALYRVSQHLRAFPYRGTRALVVFLTAVAVAAAVWVFPQAGSSLWLKALVWLIYAGGALWLTVKPMIAKAPSPAS